MTTKKVFPTKAYGDAIIIERIKIESIAEKKAKKSNIVMAPGVGAKNILELEKERMADAAKYEDAEGMLLKMWDEHPNQGVVVAVGPGRDLGGGVMLTPRVKPGEHILIRGKVGEPMVINKRLYWVIRDHDIFSTVPAANLIK